MVDHPITLKEYVIPSTKTTRQDYLNDKNRKFGGSGKFSFRKYKTDKERLEAYLLEKSENQKFLDKIKKKEENEKQELAKNYHSIEQPTMRYKPRTDLERIYYSVNEYSFGKIPKAIVNEQLSRLHLNDLKKTDQEEEQKDTNLIDKFKNLDENAIEELQTQKEFLNRQGYNEKNSETVKQIEIILSNYQEKNNEINFNTNRDNLNKEVDNSYNSKLTNKLALKNQINSNAAKKLMGEYNTKTFFKAASVFSFNLNEHKNKIHNQQKINKNEKISDKNLISGINNNHIEIGNNKTKLRKLNLDFNNKNSYLNNLNLNRNTNTQASTSLSNRTKSNCYLKFIEMDEPYYDEIQETKHNNKCSSRKNNNKVNDNNMNNINNYNYEQLDNIQTQMMQSIKSKFAKTSYGNFIPIKSRNVNNELNHSESNPTQTSYLKANSNFISFDNFNKNKNANLNINNFNFENKYDSKSLLYLKKISAYTSLPTENIEEDKTTIDENKSNSQIRKSIKLNLKNLNEMQTYNNNKTDGMSLRQSSLNDHEDNRKQDEEKITIDDETYFKSQFDLISKKVLKKCNYLNSKSDFNNKMLVTGQGKLMMTSGLTINEFAKKFNIPK